jgi:hypothetical protein
MTADGDLEIDVLKEIGKEDGPCTRAPAPPIRACAATTS